MLGASAPQARGLVVHFGRKLKFWAKAPVCECGVKYQVSWKEPYFLSEQAHFTGHVYAARFIMRRGVNTGGSVNFDAELMLVAALALTQR